MNVRMVLLFEIVLLLSVGVTYADNAVDVASLGAIGDGKSDSSKAFRTGLARAGLEKKNLFIPRGIYVLSGRVTVPSGVTVRGNNLGNANTPESEQPVLLFPESHGHGLDMASGSSLRGVTLRYGHYFEELKNLPRSVTKDPRQMKDISAAIILNGNAVRLENVNIQNPWFGISTKRGSRLQDISISDTYILNPLVGVRLINTRSGVACRNIQIRRVQNRYPLVNSTGYMLGGNREIEMVNCVLFFCQFGFYLAHDFGAEKSDGPNNATLYGCQTDYAINGFIVKGKQDVWIQSSVMKGLDYQLDVDGNDASVSAKGCYIRSSRNPSIRVSASGSVSISGCVISRYQPKFQRACVLLRGGNAVLEGNSISSQGPCIVFENNAVATIRYNAVSPKPGFQAVTGTGGSGSIIRNNTGTGGGK